jgi:lipoprotein Spr
MSNQLLVITMFLLASCDEQQTNGASTIIDPADTSVNVVDTVVDNKDVYTSTSFNGTVIQTGKTTPQELLSFATSLIGIPYKYGSVDPAQGFDCSGFITYVFSHFNIAVPRSSVDFTNVEREIELSEAKPGDIILYTGTDSTIHVVGHMGIITSNDSGAVQFIHSTSGRADGVTTTPLNPYYMGRFVKVLRVFKQNDEG